MTRWILFFSLITGATLVQATSSNPEPRWGHSTRATQWTAEVRESLLNGNNALLKANPSDVTRFCPRFSSLDTEGRLRFWTQLVSAMAEKESDFNETETYTEAFKDSSGTHVVSRGLLQLSFESAKLYGCPVRRASDLQTSATNLDCGLRIIKRWVLEDGKIGGDQSPWRGIARYWGVFRQRKKFQQIQATVYNSSICRSSANTPGVNKGTVPSKGSR